MIPSNSLPGEIEPTQAKPKITFKGRTFYLDNLDFRSLVNTDLPVEAINELLNLIDRFKINPNFTLLLNVDEPELKIESKQVFDIKIGQTNRAAAIRRLKRKLNSEDSVILSEKQVINCPELGIELMIDERELVQGIDIYAPFSGKTEQGLVIGATMEEISKLYGQPLISSFVKAIWPNFSVTLKDQVLTRIHLK